MALLLTKSITINNLIAHVSLLLVISFISLSECDEKTITDTNNTTGLTIDLHHLVFTPTSPQYNPSLSHSQRVADALNRSSFNRRVAADAVSMASSNQHSQATANITNPDGTFYLQIYIGNPPVSMSGVLDSASDLIWTSSCRSSVKSSPILCGTDQCSLFPERNCSGPNTKCTYSTGYGDGSTVQGTLSTGTISFTSGPQIQNAIIGCGTDSDRTTIGIVGLGGGPISLVRQFGSSKFGFCLAPFGSTSKLHLGDNAVAAGGVEVPLVPNEKNKPTFYKVSVGSIIVGKKALNLGGNMLIDTGTTMTMFPKSFYNLFLGAVNASIGNKFLKSTDPNAPPGLLCYANLPSDLNATVVFGNNKRLTWKLENLFLQFSKYSWCLAAGISRIEDSIFGSTALTNFAVGLDLDVKVNTITFQKTACAGK